MFAGDAYEALQNAGAADVVTCDTVAHPSNRIDLTDVLAQGVCDLLNDSVGNVES